MKDTVTLKELIAIAVRRGQLAVILALAFAALMGGWRSYTLFKAANSEDNRPEEIEKRYQETLETCWKAPSSTSVIAKLIVVIALLLESIFIRKLLSLYSCWEASFISARISCSFKLASVSL